tara:strand:- start:656 stop:955 length:300 start_codon:yes stop_codon:yes gene_type:complete
MINRRLILRKRPETTAVTFDDCLEIVSEEILPDKLKKNEFVVKNLMLTIDPTQRMWMTNPAGTGFVSQVPLDTVMKGGCIGQVVISNNKDFPVGCKTEG